MPKNAFYAQSGGVTSVINASACGVIERAREQSAMGKVYAGMNGILGALREELIDTSKETKAAIRQLKTTPSGAFGSCRYKLRAPEAHPLEYERILEVFRAHDIGYFFYNGGGDSQDTANKLAQYSIQQGFPVTCIGIPKTVDNDLPLTDTCPGVWVGRQVRSGVHSRGIAGCSLHGGNVNQSVCPRGDGSARGLDCCCQRAHTVKSG